ncbi:glycosyltransferase family 2 protein [bacterium]|nr:glycosyltransferase family 2 protein [bacterium]
MKVSIIIPAYNESATLPTILFKILALSFDKEIIVIDDGSTDETAEIVRALNNEIITVLSNTTNRGKGYSIRRALEFCSGEVIIIQDADLEYDPDELPKLLEPFDNGARVVYGSRILQPANGMSYMRYYLGGRLLTALTNVLYHASLTDEPTGYKLFRRELLQDLDLQSEGFEFCPEVTAKLLRRKEIIKEIPISYAPRSFGQGKKISWRDGLRAVYILVKYRLSKRPERGPYHDKSI